MTARPLAAAIGLINALILASTFYVWRFSYFWLDDFNAFYWVQRLDQSFGQMLWACLNPFSNAFRPVGMLFYWMFWHLFDMNPLPYHVFAWTLHTMNVILLYVLLSRIMDSRYAAAVGALVFGFRANFADIYWSFGTIFELLALFLMLLALLANSSKLKFHWRIVSVTLLYVFAIESKEMAITLPAALLLYDVCFRRELTKRVLAAYGALGLFGGAVALSKVASMGSASRTDPYYMDLSVLTLGRGYGWYFDHLYGLKLRWGAWAIASVLFLAFFLYGKNRRGLFFLGYVFVTLSPVVFLVNHRFEFFWYIPFLGISGLAAVLIDAIQKPLKALKAKMPPAVLATVGLIAFTIMSAGHFWRERRASAELLRNERSIGVEFERFVGALQSLSSPEPHATIYFRSMPRYFDPQVLTFATQAIMHRTDITTQVVDAFPDACRSCVQFVR